MRNYDEYIFSTLKSALALKPHRSNTMTISFDLSKVDFDKYRTQPELAELSHDEFMKELREFLNTIFETKSVTNIIIKD